ncbi:histidine kinase [Flammeovirga sp. SJP92]|uniref:histidine kinase n=1 Tax=Flammeovirga sp. SJP92 TaxID=1775430 RepID=UPI000787C96F|nr:histidine kinase [Flammeovirga sp. SJP92]KXX71000.1 hypothetical protein AVL50_10380 [Flammeovirga sp. SJP92]
MLHHIWNKSAVYYRIFYPFFSGSVTYFLLLLVFNRIGELSDSYFRAEWLVCIVFAYFWNTTVLVSSRFIGKKIKFISSITEQVTYHVIGVAICSSIVIGIVIYLYFYYLIGYTSIENFLSEMYVLQGLFLFQTFIYECAWWGATLIELKNETINKEEDRRAAYISKEMRLFAEDANLPLLYETLETLIGLAYKNPDHAEDYAEKLAKVYRNTINNRKEEFVSIKEAVKTTKDVVQLLTDARSGGLTADFDIDEKLSEELVIPPVILSRLVVAIASDHIATPIQPLHLKFYIEDEALLVVAHSCNEKIDKPGSMNEIMQSLEETFRIYTKTPILRIKKGKECLIKLPAFQVENENWKKDGDAQVSTGDQSLFQ